jgi:hypothetical protein
MAVANIAAFYHVATITVVKSFTVQAPELVQSTNSPCPAVIKVALECEATFREHLLKG